MNNLTDTDIFQMGWIRQLDQQNLSFWQFCEDVTFLSDGALRSDPKINDWKGDLLSIENVHLPIPPRPAWEVYGKCSQMHLGELQSFLHLNLGNGHTLAVSSWPHFQAKAWHLLPTPWDRHHVLTLLILHRIVEWTKPCGAPRAAITRIASSLVSLCGGSSSRSRLTSRIALLVLRLK